MMAKTKDESLEDGSGEIGETGDENEGIEADSPLDKYLPEELKNLRKGGGKGNKAKVDKEIVQIYVTEKLMTRLGEFKTQTELLIEEFQRYEDYFAARSYSSLLLQMGLINPLVRFRGSGDANVDSFYFEFYDKVNFIRQHKRNVKRKLDEILNPIRPLKDKLEKILRHLDEKDFLDKDLDLKEISDKVPYLSKLLRKVKTQREQFAIQKQQNYEDAVLSGLIGKEDGKITSDDRTPEDIMQMPDYLGELIEKTSELKQMAIPNPLHEYILTKELGLTNSILDMAWAVSKAQNFTEQYRRFQLPLASSGKVALYFHRTLNKILGLGRQIEILFTERFAKILMNHPELREDYAKAEYYSLLILRNMTVSEGTITMAAKEFIFAYREIQSRLYLMAGDADALMNRMLTSLTPEPNSQLMQRAAKEIMKNLENSRKPKRPKKLQDDGDTIE